MLVVYLVSFNADISFMTFTISHVAIIGAGPSGLAAAQHLLAHQSTFSSITIFERRERVGGVWNHDPTPSESPWSSPMYDDLHANLPGSLMEFANRPFPDGEGARVFPDREVIREYIEGYADKEVRKCVRFGVEVEDVRRSAEGWTVSVTEIATGKGEVVEVDAVVVANGHYAIPQIPFMPGLDEFTARHPGVVTHSKLYRSNELFNDKSVIVVGNGPSGLDIARQISRTAHQPVCLSVRHSTSPEKLKHCQAVEVPQIAAFMPETRGVRFIDGSETNNVDAIVMCTGYRYSYPFLQGVGSDVVDRAGKTTKGLYQWMFHQDPTLVFLGLPMNVVPFPWVEAQAAVMTGVWANELALVSEETRAEWCQRLGREKGDARNRFAVGEDGVYLN